MNFFKTNYFTFNGINSKQFQLQMCQVDDSNDFICGLDRNINQSDKNIKDKKEVLYVENNYVEIQCNMARIEGCKILPMTYQFMFDVNRFLYKKQFLPLEFNGFTLNVMVKSMSQTQYTKNGQGYITVTFLCEPYMTKRINKYYNSVTTTEFEIYNRSNVDDCIDLEYIDIHLISGDYIKIHNMTNGKEFFIENIESDTKNIRILIDDYRYVYNIDNDNDNVYKKITKKEWKAFELLYGKNNIKIDSEKSKIDIYWREKICLM